MIRNILFDLDGTLLPMDQDVFVRSYMQSLMDFYGERGLDPEVVGAAMMQAIIEAMKNRSGKTNEERFWEVFMEHAGVDLRDKPEDLYRFYATVHPTLCGAVVQGRNSRRPVEMLQAKGYRLILATNPLFPYMATYQRMSWAGLRPSDFELVTTYESSYRCKPNPEYFVEILKRMDLKPEECLMVGNDTRDDGAALMAGLELYLITDHLIDRSGRGAEGFRHGTFEDFLTYVESLPDLTEEGDGVS